MSTCSRPGCSRPASTTLVYDYASSTATLRDLVEPHPMQYDLCAAHADRLSVPRGWALRDERVGTVVPIRRWAAG